MMDQEYWTKRFEQLEQAAHRDAMEIMGDVDRFYREATRELDGDISRWYQRFANNNGIVDMAEARRLFNSTELKEFKWTVDDYIKHGQENGITADWSRQLENASARWHISRYEALKVQLQNTVEVLYGNQLDAMDELARKTFLETYGHTAFEIQKGLGVGWDVAGLNRGAIEKAVQKPWSLDGRNFSERIWGNREKLINELHQQLTQNLMRGGNVNDVIAHIEKTMGVSHSNAKRLVLTENAYIHSVAQEESYKKLGVKAVVFIATLDERTSQECRDMDGTVIEMKDYQPGVNIPPLHPYCRSCTAPHFADMVGLGERVATNPDTGQQYFIPRSTTYREWEKAFMQDPVTGESGSKEGLKEVLPGAILSLSDCKTVSDVEQWMKNQSWFSPDSNKIGTSGIRLSGVDFESAKGIAEAYEQVMNEFPYLIGNITAVQAKALDAGTYAQCFTRGGGGVEVSTRFFKNVQAVITQYEKDLAAGYHPAGTDWKSIITHELGHALDGYLTNLGIAGSNRGGWDYKDVSALLRPQVMRSCGLKVSDIGKEVSWYATKNAREWFAECFAEAVRSANPRRVAVEFMKQLKQLVKEKGVK